jgi:predicted TIM-barrel fold metal-dependent hydrolase
VSPFGQAIDIHDKYHQEIRMNSPDDSDDYRIVSVDDHIVEPPTLWTDRLAKKLHDTGPRVRKTRVLPHAIVTGNERDIFDVGPDDESVWCDVWHFEEERYALTRATASVTFEASRRDRAATTYEEIRPGCYQWEERLDDMDVDGVIASLCFPNVFVQFCGQRFLRAKDKDLALLCIQAYNDFLIDEWAGPSKGRLLGSAILPLWDVALSVAEVERNVARGCRSVCFSEIPSRLGLASMYSDSWDPLFEACARHDVVISIHVGSSSSFQPTLGAPLSVGPINFFSNTAQSLTDWIMSGALARFPDLKVAFSEGQAGWVPYLMERMDVMWKNGNANHEVRLLPDRPSSFLRNVYFCIYDDIVGLSFIDLLGENNVCFETDYPHPDGTFPDSRAVAAANVASLDPRRREKVLRSNAVQLYRFDI